jgi:hypothetical protein
MTCIFNIPSVAVLIDKDWLFSNEDINKKKKDKGKRSGIRNWQIWPHYIRFRPDRSAVGRNII